MDSLQYEDMLQCSRRGTFRAVSKKGFHCEQFLLTAVSRLRLRGTKTPTESGGHLRKTEYLILRPSACSPFAAVSRGNPEIGLLAKPPEM